MENGKSVDFVGVSVADAVEWLTGYLGVSAAMLASLLNLTEQTLLAAALPPGADAKYNRPPAAKRKAERRVLALNELARGAALCGVNGRIFLNIVNEPMDMGLGEGDSPSILGLVVDEDLSHEALKSLAKTLTPPV